MRPHLPLRMAHPPPGNAFRPPPQSTPPGPTVSPTPHTHHPHLTALPPHVPLAAVTPHHHTPPLPRMNVPASAHAEVAPALPRTKLGVDGRPLPKPAPDGVKHPWPRLDRAVSIALWIVIPATIYYTVLVADYGPHEHIYSPVRRWAKRMQSKFWTLSEEEQKVARAVEAERAK